MKRHVTPTCVVIDLDIKHKETETNRADADSEQKKLVRRKYLLQLLSFHRGFREIPVQYVHR